jgi:hypothetical protein
MEKNMEAINVGDKVLFKTLQCGIIKAVVVSKRVEHTDHVDFQRYTIKVTSRNNRIFCNGYTFEVGNLHIWSRE